MIGLFGRKKKDEVKSCCGRTENGGADGSADKGILVLGSGCAKCNQLEAAVKEALLQLGIEEPIHHVKDFAQIAAYGVMTTPALVVDGKVVSSGKVLKTAEAVELLQKLRG